MKQTKKNNTSQVAESSPLYTTSSTPEPRAIISISEARAKLPSLLSSLSKNKSILLTQRGKPKAVLVDSTVWYRVINRLAKFYEPTYVDSQTAPFTRDFSDQEIQEWLEEDKL